MKASNWKNYLKPEEIKSLYALDNKAIVRDTLIVWALILSTLALFSATGNFVIFLFGVFIIAVQQHHLTTFVHEGAHNNIIAGNKKLNDFVSDILYAGPILVSTPSYRARHSNHHKHLGVAHVDDEINDRHLISQKFLFKNILLCLSGVRAVSSFLGHAKTTSDDKADTQEKLQSILRHYAPIALTNLFLLVWCWAFGNIFTYLFLWLAPLGTITMLLVMFRVIAEHQTVEYSLRDEEDFDHNIEEPITRTIDPPFWQKWIFGPLNFCYHHEHHLLPAIPYSKLPKLHSLLKERGYYSDNPEFLSNSYIQILRGKLDSKNLSPIPTS